MGLGASGRWGQRRGAGSIQPIFFQPRLGQGAEAEEPVVELLQGPAAAEDEAAVEAFVFEASKPVAHGDAGGGGVPVDLGFGTGGGEAEVFL